MDPISVNSKTPRRPRLAASWLAACALVLALRPAWAQTGAPLRVFTAKTIVTMDRTQPTAEAVAVADGRIVGVGTLASLQPWLDSREHVIDTQFADRVLLPGLIDNHLHPFLAAILLNTHWITPQEWNVPGLHVDRTRGSEAYLAALKSALQATPDTGDPFITWGYHEMWHGILRRAELDEISSTRPIILWQRSFHEVIVNSAGLRWMGLDPAVDEVPQDSDFEKGMFSERGLLVALQPIAGYLLAPERLQLGLDKLRNIIWQGGITTIADMGVGAYMGFQAEAGIQKSAFGGEDTPFRTILVPGVVNPDHDGDPASLVEQINGYLASSADKIRVPKAVKMLADGAFFAQYMRMKRPGYIDGHEGKWLTEPDVLARYARAFWNAGYQIHVHVNGDEGLEVTLEMLDNLLDTRPRFDHRFTLHHVGYSTNDQLRRAAALGVVISAQPYYLWALGDAYAKNGLGYDRASQMARIGSMMANGIPVSLHSDFTMAPAAPLTLAWVAANRRTSEGTLMAPEERISVEQALRAITIDAAFALRMEDEIGSIVAGKRADFTVLDRNPLEVGAGALQGVRVLATIFEGEAFPLPADRP